MFFLYFIIIAIGIIIMLRLSKIQLELKKIKIFADTKKIMVLPDYEIIIRIYVLRKIKILDRKIKKGDLKSQKRLKKLQDRLKIKENGKQNNIKMLRPKNLKNINIILKNTNLNIGIETENAALTAMLVGLLYAIIPNFLNYFFQLRENIKLKIEPIYQNKNQITLSFDGIFEFDLLHIINIYKVLMVKERKGVKNGASNRKSYAYNNG